MNKLSLILLSLSISFPLSNNAMDLNLATTIKTNFINKQNNLAILAIAAEMHNINSLKRTHENAFDFDITKQSKRQCLENKNHTNYTKKTFICTECNKAFTQKGDLTRHLRTHTNERPFSCTINGCNKAFTQKTDLTIHIRTHTNERPYNCTFNGCNKAFTIKGNLTRHLRTHTGEKPFMCTFNECNATFTQQGSLNRHLITHANKLNPQDIKY